MENTILEILEKQLIGKTVRTESTKVIWSSLSKIVKKSKSVTDLQFEKDKKKYGMISVINIIIGKHKIFENKIIKSIELYSYKDYHGIRLTLNDDTTAEYDEDKKINFIQK